MNGNIGPNDLAVGLDNERQKEIQSLNERIVWLEGVVKGFDSRFKSIEGAENEDGTRTSIGALTRRTHHIAENVISLKARISFLEGIVTGFQSRFKEIEEWIEIQKGGQTDESGK